MLGYASFQLFGFDFLLDDQLQVHLIEINGAPACAEWVYWYLCCLIKLSECIDISVVTSIYFKLFHPKVLSKKYIILNM